MQYWICIALRYNRTPYLTRIDFISAPLEYRRARFQDVHIMCLAPLLAHSLQEEHRVSC